MRKWIGLLVVSFMLFVLVACKETSSTSTSSDSSSKKGSSDDTVKIGVILAETGPASGLGKPEVDAINLVKKKLEENGGKIGDKKVEIIMMDYESDDTKAILHMKKLVEEGVSVVYGATQVSTSLAVHDMAEEHGIVYLSGSPIGVLGDYTFQTGQTNEVLIQQITDYLLENDLKKIAWVNARDAFGQSGLPVMEEVAKKNGIDIVAVEDFDASATDMTLQLSKIKSKNPDSIVVWSRTPGAGVVAKNFKQLGFDIPMIQSQAASNDAFIEQIGGEGENIFVQSSKINILNDLPNSDYKDKLIEHNEAMQSAYNYPGDIFTTKATDAMNMILKAVEAGNATSDEIKAFFENDLGEYQGISAVFKYSKKNHAGADVSGVGLYSIKDYKWQYQE